MSDRPRLHLRVGQKIGPGEVYEILDSDGSSTSPENPDRPAKPCGVGGSSTVYRARFRGLQERALKFLTLNYLSGETGQHESDFQVTFQHEIATLAQLSHGNIARLYDSDNYVDETGVTWQFIVMDFIAGDDILTVMSDPATSAEEAFDLVSQVLRALAYMHARGVLHADVKHKNILCRDLPVGPEAVILDLGVAHDRPAEDKDRQAAHRFITTRRILHEVHERYYARKMTEQAFDSLFPSHDIHSVGILLQQLYDDTGIREKFARVIGQDGVVALAEFIDRLRQSPVGGPYTSMSTVLGHWTKLSKTYLAPAGVPELSLAAEYKYSMHTTSGRSVITPRVASVINHKLFQRLHRIPQLELTLKKFSEATHTRLSHSITVFRNARYYVAHLLNDPNFRLAADQHDIEALLLLGLLHDVGHYQLSHMFEDFASDQRVRRGRGPWSQFEADIPTDDDLFWSVVDPDSSSPLRGDYGAVIRDAAARSSRRLDTPAQPKLADLIQREFGDRTYAAMREMHASIHQWDASHEYKDAHLVLAAVLSSDIDADKVSYLVEDSLRTGVPYGAGVDFDALLGALRMPDKETLRSRRPTLGITLRGVAAAQSVAMSRTQMVGEVYWHHTNRAMTAMVKYVVARLIHHRELSMPEFIGDTLFAEYEAALDHVRVRFDRIRRDGEVNPITGLLDGERGIYLSAFSTARLGAELGDEVAERLIRLGFDEVIQLEGDLVELIREIPSCRDAKLGEVLVDTPLKERERPSGDRGSQVVLYEDRVHGVARSLREHTPWLRNLHKQHLRENRVCRVFVAPRLARAERLETITQRLISFMTETR